MSTPASVAAVLIRLLASLMIVYPLLGIPAQILLAFQGNAHLEWGSSLAMMPGYALLALPGFLLYRGSRRLGLRLARGLE
jgi:hypothetical protein